jgi:hypothetical protein
MKRNWFGASLRVLTCYLLLCVHILNAFDLNKELRKHDGGQEPRFRQHHDALARLDRSWHPHCMDRMVLITRACL